MPNHSAWGWHSLRFRAMNTNVEIQLYTNTYDRTLEGVKHMFRKAEERLTRFDLSSELCQLNRSAGRPRRVSSLLFDVVEVAVWAALATHGLFDPTLLRVMEAIGYDRSFEQIKQYDQAEAPPLPTTRRERYKGINLNRSRREIYLPPDVQLDLGGIGKGWTVDRAADWLAGKGPFMINAGGDLYSYGTPPVQPAWSIGIIDPWDPARDIARLQVRQRAVATSTISRRRWQRGERTMHHLIDPRSGQPAATDAVSVTVVAHRVALAEVYAKVALILGAEAGRNWLNHIVGVEGLLVRNDGQLMFTNGFPLYREVIDDNTTACQSRNHPSERSDDLGDRDDSRHLNRHAFARDGFG